MSGCEEYLNTSSAYSTDWVGNWRLISRGGNCSQDLELSDDGKFRLSAHYTFSKNAITYSGWGDYSSGTNSTIIFDNAQQSSSSWLLYCFLTTQSLKKFWPIADISKLKVFTTFSTVLGKVLVLSNAKNKKQAAIAMTPDKGIIIFDIRGEPLYTKFKLDSSGEILEKDVNQVLPHPLQTVFISKSPQQYTLDILGSTTATFTLRNPQQGQTCTLQYSLDGVVTKTFILGTNQKSISVDLERLDRSLKNLTLDVFTFSVTPNTHGVTCEIVLSSTIPVITEIEALYKRNNFTTLYAEKNNKWLQWRTIHGQEFFKQAYIPMLSNLWRLLPPTYALLPEKQLYKINLVGINTSLPSSLRIKNIAPQIINLEYKGSSSSLQRNHGIAQPTTSLESNEFSLASTQNVRIVMNGDVQDYQLYSQTADFTPSFRPLGANTVIGQRLPKGKYTIKASFKTPSPSISYTVDPSPIIDGALLNCIYQHSEPSISLHLVCPAYQITSLAGLEQVMPRLTQVILSDNTVSDPSPLHKLSLSNMKALSLDYNKIKRLDQLEKFPIKKLSLAGNPLESVALTKGSPLQLSLQFLDLSNTNMLSKAELLTLKSKLPEALVIGSDGMVILP